MSMLVESEAASPRSADLTHPVQVRDLVKRYPKSAGNAVDGVSFAVAQGEVFGLLGPNGAGKTTTIGILTTRVRATSGVGRVGDVDVTADPVGARRRLSVVPQRSNLDQALTARQNLVFHAAYHGIPVRERNHRADILLNEFGLEGRGKDKVTRYSGGMAQRLMIARALMHAPEVLFLDEPSTGLDPQARLFVWDRIRDLKAAGVTIVLTTHDMDEAAELADRVGIMDHGRLLALDTPEALTRSLPGSTTLDLTISMPVVGEATEIAASLDAVDGVEKTEQIAGDPAEEAGEATSVARMRVYLTDDASTLLGPVTEQLRHHDGRITAMNIGEPSLEDVFIHHTGRDLR